ncbi:hypothetical protein SNEBB_006054 [Seison nebaliae]|nr:hypothetical protein SNEBB_006054 [Seison nebaliae]
MTNDYNNRRLRIQFDEDEEDNNDDYTHHPRRSLGTILGLIVEAKEDSENLFEFLRKALILISKSGLSTAAILCMLCVPLIMIMVGMQWLNECPRETKIPIYLLVGGFVACLRFLHILWKTYQARRHEKNELLEIDDQPLPTTGSCFTYMLLDAFIAIWFVCGNYWILKIWWPNFHAPLKEPSNYCSRTLYLFALAQLALGHTLLLSLLVLIGTLTLYALGCTNCPCIPKSKDKYQRNITICHCCCCCGSEIDDTSSVDLEKNYFQQSFKRTNSHYVAQLSSDDCLSLSTISGNKIYKPKFKKKNALYSL